MLKTTSRVGPYEILGQLGAGGMGEVYRARDTRLRRDVAVKVLPSEFSADPSRLRRFEQEARAAAALNHPNILAVHDIGSCHMTTAETTAAVAVAQECPYIVGELLEGETLRDRLRSGPIPIRKAVDYAQQIARGLAAAHDKSIVHRDLKPENIFITEDGRVKILDFGLAKLTSSNGGSGPLYREESDSGNLQAQTQTVHSDARTVLGTVGYMSPEQVRGKQADARSDLFSFGAMLYEMLSGKRAFQCDSPAETLSAILKEEPPELTETNRNVPPALERVVRHCLEKNPAARFQSARDVEFALETATEASKASGSVPTMTASPTLRPGAWGLAAVVALALVAIGLLVGTRIVHPEEPSYHRLTFQLGTVFSARFAPDGQTILYTAMWNGEPVHLFSVTTLSGLPDSRALMSVRRTCYPFHLPAS